MQYNILKIFKLMRSKVHSIIVNGDGRDVHLAHLDLGHARQLGHASTPTCHPGKTHPEGSKVSSSIVNGAENGLGWAEPHPSLSLA